MYSFPQGGMVKKEVVPGFKFKSLFRACTVTHLAPGDASSTSRKVQEGPAKYCVRGCDFGVGATLCSG